MQCDHEEEGDGHGQVDCGIYMMLNGYRTGLAHGHDPGRVIYLALGPVPPIVSHPVAAYRPACERLIFCGLKRSFYCYPFGIRATFSVKRPRSELSLVPATEGSCK